MQTLDAIEAHLLEAGAAAQDAMQLRIVAEEIVTNIARCAWPAGERREFAVELAVDVRLDGLHVRMTTIDDGAPFDPTIQPTPNVDVGLDERQTGGLGMLLVREMTERQHYVREEGRNRFSVERLLRRATA